MNDINSYDSGGSQPYFHDQLADLYERYIVETVDFTARFHTASNTTSDFDVGIYASAEGWDPASVGTELLAEKLGSIVKPWTQSLGLVTITGSIPLYQLAGIPKQNWHGNDAYQAPFGSSPSYLLYLTVLASAKTVIASLMVDIDLVFHGRAMEVRRRVAS
jgi:hypothetical protein